MLRRAFIGIAAASLFKDSETQREKPKKKDHRKVCVHCKERIENKDLLAQWLEGAKRTEYWHLDCWYNSFVWRNSHGEEEGS